MVLNVILCFLMLCSYRYSFDLCGFEAVEAAALEATNRGSRTRCERQVTAVDSFLSQQEKKQKHHRRKRKCVQSRDHLHFLSELEEVRKNNTFSVYCLTIMCKWCIGLNVFLSSTSL